MNQPSKGAAFGMSDAELAAYPTVFHDGLLAGKTVLVSGAGTGLGRGIAHLFARLGANLMICGRDPAKLEDVTPHLEKYGNRVASMAMTIRETDQVEALMDRTWAEYGGLDILINNAGGQFPLDSIDYTPKGWRAVIDTNLNGTWNMTQAAAKRWIADKTPGSIVNITAISWRGIPQISHTAAARAGVDAMAKSLAVEWAPHDIRINCVAPGSVESSGFAVYPDAGRKTFYDANPMMRTGDLMDVAEACVYVGGPSGKFVTGIVLPVDGGQQLWGEMWPYGKPDYFEE